jgi:CBS domain containing-hemolysin-like protein
VLARWITILVLVLLNGFFVAAEFALVRSRRTRLEAMTRKGDKLARVALRATGNIGSLLSASQLGVTLSSLGLGWVAESALKEPFAEWFAHLPIGIDVALAMTIGATLAIIVITFLHVVFGELTPKAGALNHPEQFARWLAPPLQLFAWLTTPFTWILNHSSQFILALFGERGAKNAEDAVHSPEELQILVEQAQEGGALKQQDADMLGNVFDFSEKTAREVMTPRTEIIALAEDATLEEVLETVRENGFSRYPVYRESIDDIVGLVLAKDLLAVLSPSGSVGAGEPFVLAKVMRPVHVIPGSREVEDVLGDFKRLKEHLAIVLDEYGGTAGLVTMEDLLEEIVGEILDEYDEPEEEAVEVRAGETLIPGSTHIGELNEHFGLSVPESDYNTIGGYVFGVLGRLPQIGDRVMAGGAIFTVREMDGRKIDTLAIDLHSLGDRRSSERDPQSPGREEPPL